MAYIAFPLNCKTFKTPSSSTTYSYVHIPPSSTKPTILFLHGFPSSSYDWRYQITHFSSLSYGVLIPDLLGYGGTDKPTSPAAYKVKEMATEVMDILEHEKLDKVHAVGHDFGSHILSRIIDYFPHRLLSSTFIAIPYIAPGQHFDLEMVKQITEKAIGFEKYGYMRFLSRENSPEILEAHPESFTSLIYASGYARYINFYLTGELEKWLTADSRLPQSSSIVSEAENSTHNQILSQGGYRGPTNWYRALVGNLNEDDEKAAMEAGTLDPQIKCPVLAIDSAPGRASIPGFMEENIRPFAKDVRFKAVPTEGHWVQIESRDEVNAWVEEFLKEVEG